MEIPAQMILQFLNNRNNPAMAQFHQMMAGKNTEQQIQTLMNFARSSGIDPDAKIFSAEYLRSLGVQLPPNQG